MAPDLVRRDYKRKVTRTLTRHGPIPAFYIGCRGHVGDPCATVGQEKELTGEVHAASNHFCRVFRDQRITGLLLLLL